VDKNSIQVIDMTNYITFTQTTTKNFYFNSYDSVEKWEDNPENMVDGSVQSFADTFTDLKVQLCDGNTCTETGTVTITKIEIRDYSLAGAYTATITDYLQPVFSGGDGDLHSWIPPNAQDDEPAGWSDWFDITNDTNAPATWTWADVTSLEVDHYPDLPAGGDPYSLNTSKIEIRVSYVKTCTMIVPEQVSTDHTQNVKEMNMWNGDRIVFGESRSRWSLLLKGSDWEDDACNRILCLKQLGLDGIPVVLSGLNNTNWDIEWMIKSIGWRLVTENPIHYEWIILLEKT
jgi:hypothetical protein